MGLRKRPFKSYTKPGRLQDVLALIQVLGLDEKAHRSESGLQDELQGVPRSTASWTELAQAHPEFFRVRAEGEHRVSLVSRHVTPKNEHDIRPLPAEFIGKLVQAAIDLHDRQVRRDERWAYWLPILGGLISAIVVIYSLWSQIRQQNELERKRVEATYLAKALDVVHTPSDVVMKLAIDNHEFKNRLKVSPETKVANYEAGRVFNESFQQSTRAYSDAMTKASYFAELIEPESSLRKGGRNELFEVMVRAQDATVALYQLVPDAISERIPLAQLSQQPLYVRADAANREAGKAMVRRLQELYGRAH